MRAQLRVSTNFLTVPRIVYIYPIIFCFSLFFNLVTALDLCTKCVSPKYLPNKWLHFEKILLVLSKFKMHTNNERSGGVS